MMALKEAMGEENWNEFVHDLAGVLAKEICKEYAGIKKEPLLGKSADGEV